MDLGRRCRVCRRSRWPQAWSTAFVNEQVMSGFYFGGVAGVLGHFLLTYDHGRRQKVIDDNRKAMIRLTALLERTNNQD